MSGRRLILLMSVSMDGFAGRPDRTIDWPALTGAYRTVVALAPEDDRAGLAVGRPRPVLSGLVDREVPGADSRGEGGLRPR